MDIGPCSPKGQVADGHAFGPIKVTKFSELSQTLLLPLPVRRSHAAPRPCQAQSITCGLQHRCAFLYKAL